MRLTEDLVRKKSEHNDGVLEDLEEVSLHQLEIERLEGLGACKKLRIVYLQNNIIPRIENLHHCKDLRYLNLALNNISRIEGLGSCEFLNKLDLTVNFIDVDQFEASLDHLRPLLHLRELFLMGNPASDWAGCRAYVAATLPQLAQLDGKEIARGERILAQQAWRGLRAELRALAAARREALGLPPAPPPPPAEGEEDLEPWSPETRTKMYREMAEQKAEAEAKKGANAPRKRDYETEHAAAVRVTRERERAAAGSAGGGAGGGGGGSEDGSGSGSGELPRQTNEGRWEFTLEEEDGANRCVLRLQLSRFLDSSLVDADVHPRYVSIVVKNKVFRILWPEEVRSSEAVAQRSGVTGELCVSAPKVRAGSAALQEAVRRREREAAEGQRWSRAREGVAGGGARGRAAPATLAEQLAAAAAAGGGGRAVRLEGLAGAGVGAGGGAGGGGGGGGRSSDYVGGGSAAGASLFREAGSSSSSGSSGSGGGASGAASAGGGGGGGGRGTGSGAEASATAAAAAAAAAPAAAPAAAYDGSGPPPLEDVPIVAARARQAAPRALIQEHRG